MKKILPYCIIIFMTIFAIDGLSQVAISTNGSQPNNSAMLDVISSTKGLLAPRMTSFSDVNFFSCRRAAGV